jgi:hypothetical protein
MARRLTSLTFLLTLAWLAGGSSLRAQTTSASVFGSVQDSQGGVLPTATVTLTSRTQGNTLTTTTDEQGHFVFPIVRPDSYALKVTMQGFKTLERTNVVVSANDKFSTGILTLEVGEMTESISVVGRVSELQAESGERSFTLQTDTLHNIGGAGRSLFLFTALVPGISPNNGAEAPAQASDFNVNGQRSSQNNVTFDGVANIDTGNNGGNMATTNIDAVAEFKVLTNAYQAEYGRAAGGQIQVVTKSGTREFHGSGYWYGRRSGWNANSWTNNRDGVDKAESSRNDYGYTFGGPIFIPGVFNEDRQKLFFFWSQEFQKRKDPVSERLSRVPTALERQGDFSQSVDNNGNPWPYIRDYTTGLPCGPDDTSGCFADGGVLGKIPADRLYQPGINALNIYPMPNFESDTGINYRSQAPNDQPRREQLLRLDFQPTDRWRVTGRYMWNKDTQTQPYGITWAGAGSGGGTNGGGFDDMDVAFAHPGKNYVVSATGLLNATTSLELSFGSAYNELVFTIGNQNLYRTAAGLNGLPLLYPDAVQEDYMPDFRFNGGHVGGNAGYYQTDRGPFINANRTYDAIANLTKVWGAHTAKFGVYYQRSWKAQSPFISFNSQINFNDTTSNPYDTNFSYANAAVGVFNTYTQASRYAYPEWVYDNFEWYLQDNWKVTPRLTLDYGVRFYYLTPQWDQTLAASNFLPDKFDPANAATLYRPAIVNGVKVAIDPNTGQTVDARFAGRLTPGSGRFNGAFEAGQGINDQMQSGNVFKISPRFGFVYDLSGSNTAIVRGGFGIYYDRPMGNVVFDLIANAPGTLQPQLQWGLLQNLGEAAGAPDPTLTLYPTAYDFIPPRVFAWNVGFQKKLAHALLFDIAYVGSKSDRLLSQEQINSVPYGAKFLDENHDPTLPVSDLPGGNALADDFLRPYQGYGGIRLWDYRGYSNYHSLQTSLQRRFDKGFMFTAFYTWSKTLGVNNDDYSTIRPFSSDAENTRVNYSYVNYDRPHIFVVNLIYQVPHIADGAGGVLLNDWQISGAYRYMSGTPYTINFSIPGISAANLTGSDGNNNARVIVTCDPGKGSSGDPYSQLNQSCFAPPQPGSLGDESARYFVHGPPVNNVNLSLSKSFRLGERVRFEVRLDAFNALNHTLWRGVNNSVSFASLSDPTVTNLPYDADGNLVRQNGFGTINGVRPPRQLQLVTRLSF